MMRIVFAAAIALIWIAGTCFRIYRQARFYQIEEYMSQRYLRWLLASRSRWQPGRSAAAIFVGALLSAFAESVPGGVSVLPYLINGAAAGIAVYPPPEGEIKRAFKRTQRAVRILGAAFTLATIAFLPFFVVQRLEAFPTSDRFLAVFVSAWGFIIFLLAPIWLVLGSMMMTPVEAVLRRRFIHQAEQVLQAIQPRIIGITGSYGKTTTKNFLRDILNGRYKTYATPKSYNTLMGICLAINNDLKHDYSIEYFISEMGAYIEGEIERISHLTPPDISIVVDVGPQHLERFGSLEHVAAAKYEIIKALPQHGLGVFNWDNNYVRDMYERGYPNNRIAVSSVVDPDQVPAGGPRFIASDIVESVTGLAFTLVDRQTGASERIETPVIGLHNVTNLLLAAAVAVHEGMSLRDIAIRVRTLQPAESRLVRHTTDAGITIINDAYSANPVGVISALRVLGMHTAGKRLLITPGMVELGPLHHSENYKLGQAAAEYATDIILVGQQQTEPVRDGIQASGFPSGRLQVVNTLAEAVKWYKENLLSGDAVLFLNDLPDTY